MEPEQTPTPEELASKLDTLLTEAAAVQAQLSGQVTAEQETEKKTQEELAAAEKQITSPGEIPSSLWESFEPAIAYGLKSGEITIDQLDEGTKALIASYEANNQPPLNPSPPEEQTLQRTPGGTA